MREEEFRKLLQTPDGVGKLMQTPEGKEWLGKFMHTAEGKETFAEAKPQRIPLKRKRQS
ncbi:MAG: hypothetical protein AAGF35_01625 [Pseudomonadota bacterium]